VTRRRKKRAKSARKGREVQVIALDALSVRMMSLIERNGIDVPEQCEAVAREIEHETFRLLPDCMLSREASVHVLRSWMRRLEKKIADIAGTESKCFWLQLIARIAPKNVFKVGQLSTVCLYRQTLKLAVLKYGANNGREAVSTSIDPQRLYKWALEGGEEEAVPVSPGEREILLPKYVRTKDVIDAYVLERLAAGFYFCTSSLRIVWKGGHVVVRNGTFERGETNPAIEEMYKLYDERNHLPGVVRSVGSLAGSEALSTEDRFAVVVPYLNVEQIEISPEIFAPGKVRSYALEEKKDGKGFLPNYLIRIFELESLCRFMSVFDDELESKWGCSGTEICAMVGAVGMSNGMRFLESGEFRWQLVQRGYTICPSYERFQEVYDPLYRVIMEHLTGGNGKAERFRDVYTALTFRDFASIDLWDRTGSKPFLEFESGIMIDHSMLMFVADTMLAPLASARGAVGRKRGENFEQELRRFLEGHVENWSEWKFRERIHFSRHFGGARGEREIDVSFLHKDCLFIVSCKAANFGPVLDRGEGKAIWRRFDAIQEWLSEVDEVVGALANEPEGRDYCVPKMAHWVAALCCSPHVGYFPVRTRELFLTDRIPRLCVPEELVQFLAGFDPKEVADRGVGWLREVKG
jgi:hypothetical protein